MIVWRERNILRGRRRGKVGRGGGGLECRRIKDDRKCERKLV